MFYKKKTLFSTNGIVVSPPNSVRLGYLNNKQKTVKDPIWIPENLLTRIITYVLENKMEDTLYYVYLICFEKNV